MSKILTIALKDLKITFRDPAALAIFLLTPFALTLAIGFAFGGFNRSNQTAGLEDIPVVIVNHDPGQFGQQLVDVLQSPDLDRLVQLSTVQDDSAARSAVDKDRAAAAVIIPANFSESILPASILQGGNFNAQNLSRTQSVVEVYLNPGRAVSAGVIYSIVERFLNQVAAGSAGGQVTILEMLKNGLISPDRAGALGPAIGQQAGIQVATANLVTLKSETAGSSAGSFDFLSYMSPSMAILFLMFTVSAGGRSILAERQGGTLSRLLVTPSRAAQVLGGKVLGIFLTGLVQMTILIAAGWLLFGIRWGDGPAVALLVLALVAAASAWGMLLAAYARTSGQANAVGQALALIFGAIAGNFVPRPSLPEWLQNVSLISPNAWALEGFMKLTTGGRLANITTELLALLAMAAILFVIATLMFRRQYR